MQLLIMCRKEFFLNELIVQVGKISKRLQLYLNQICVTWTAKIHQKWLNVEVLIRHVGEKNFSKRIRFAAFLLERSEYIHTKKTVHE